MISCRRAAELASKALDTRLSWREGVALRAHVWVCRGCRHYEWQLGLLRRLIQGLDSKSWRPKTVLTQQARKRILEQLRREC